MGRRWGQHFLRSSGVIEKIVAAAELQETEDVLEIGPGEGVVTQRLCQKARQIHVFEIDPELAQALAEKPWPNLTVHQGDFLKQDLAPLGQADRVWKVVANLPYYITAPILNRLCWERPLPFESATLMMQEEVARRLCGPATREAGALTYIVGAFFHTEYLFKVPPGCFSPPPAVDSAVIRLRPKNCLSDPNRPHSFNQPESAGGAVALAYERLVSTAFGQRRKQLARSLRGLHPEAAKFLSSAGIDPTRRPETLTVEEFWRLARTWPISV